MSDETRPASGSSENEYIKDASNFLRGTIAQGLRDTITGGIAPSDQQLLKFHGVYQQDDRDVRLERQRQKLEPLYSFMVRVRMPGGVCTAKQYLELDRLASAFGGGSLRLTTRQTFQLHTIPKRNLRQTVQSIHKSLLDTIAACGDVNRNVMCNPNPLLSSLHGEVYAWAKGMSERLLPRTHAYHEIWLGDDLIAGGEPPDDDEPLYGKHYLPRKFKIAVAVPPSNDVDVFANDLGFIAIAEKNGLTGFNVTIGGGMGMTHGEHATYPRIGDVIGFCPPADTNAVAEAVLTTQRDFGDRKNRKHARLKYTIDEHGLDWFKAEIERRLGHALAPARPYAFTSSGDRYGWVEGLGDSWHFTTFIENGRIRDTGDRPLLTALREIAQAHDGDFRMTPNQNLMIANVSRTNRPHIDGLLDHFRLKDGLERGGLRLSAMACVALPTCGLAMAESERYLPSLLDKLDTIMRKAGLAKDAIVIRMTGCPNGCARPFLAEIGLVGKNLGKYNLYLGGGFVGDRLNKLYRENIAEEEIIAALEPILHRYAGERNAGEHFGDFVIRSGYVKATKQGKDFHD
ncbi:MAG TPA: assimilatory sulfite reductase (NADPH) hemoprotein subunit [Polyangia bacterium]